MGEPTVFLDTVAVAAREPEVPDADFDGGCNLAGSCAPGIGINMNEGAIVGTPEQFTIGDQHGTDPRASQISQHIGGSGLDVGSPGTLPDAVIRFGDNGPGDGTVDGIGNASLYTIGAGWVIQI